MLRARKAADRLRLERLVASALPASGAVAVSGSTLIGRGFGSPPLVVHVKPVAVPQPDYGARHTAALILIVDPGSRHRIDPDLVAGTLGLTPMEGRVAAWLAEGRSVREMAEATGRTEGSIYWHLKQIYRKQPVSRQAGPGAAGAVDHRVRITAGAGGIPQRAEVSPAALSFSQAYQFGRDRAARSRRMDSPALLAACFPPNLPIWQGLDGAIALDRFPGSTGRTGPPARIPVARSVQRARPPAGVRMTHGWCGAPAAGGASTKAAGPPS